MVEVDRRSSEGSSGHRRRRNRRSRRSALIVWALAGAAAVAGAAAGAQPTGTGGIDPIYAAAFAVAVTVACSIASRSTWLILTTVAVAMSRTWLLIPAVADLGVAFASVFPRHRRRRVGALVGALGSQVVLRWPHVGFQGLTAIVAAVAVAPCLISAYRHLGRRARRRARLAVGIGLVAMVVLAVPVVVGAVLARSPVTAGIADTRAALRSASSGASAAANAQLQRATREFSAASSRTGSWWTAGGTLVPVLAQQRRALARATGAAHALTTTARSEEATINLRQLGYHDGQLDLGRVRALGGPLARLDRQLGAAQHRLDGLRSGWLVEPIATRLGSLRGEVDRAARSADLASRAVAVVPGLLGGDGARHYFVAFDTPAESRGLGGFIGAYGELTATDGRVSLTRSGHITELNARAAPGTRHITGPPGYLARYGAFRPNDNIQDITYSPDLPTVTQVLAQMYPQSGGDAIDGVLVIDPVGLASLLAFTGPVTVPGLATPLTSANAAEILLKTQYQDFTGTTASEIDRHDFLQAALAHAFPKLVHGSLPNPRTLSADLDPAVRSGHLLFWSTHPAEQPLLREVRLAGAFPHPDGGDLLAVTTQNAANNKIDAYLTRRVDDTVRYDPGTGAVDATVTIALHNGASLGDAPDFLISYPGSGLPPGTNRTWLSLYSPLDLTGGTEAGNPLAATTTDELGVHAYSTYVNVPPGATETVVVHLTGHLRRAEVYRLALRQQPMVNPDHDTITVQPTDGWSAIGSLSWAPDATLDQSRSFGFRRSS